jgi:hypothetical protein
MDDRVRVTPVSQPRGRDTGILLGDMRMTRLLAVAGAAVWLTAGVAFAQVTPPLVGSVRERTLTIAGTCISGATVQLTVKTGAGGEDVRLSDARCVAGRFSSDAQALRLIVGFQVQAVQIVGGIASAPITVDVEEWEGPYGDERGDFESNAYIGLAIDTFGAQELSKYLNPEANGQLHERSIFGVNFSYRLFKKGSRQIWVYGETLHGVRSEDIDCAQTPELPSCKKELSEFGADIAKASLFLLRNATSLEAYVGVRLELAQLNMPGLHPAAVYVNFQPGFLEVAGSDGDAKAAHHVGIGAQAVGGAMQGSYLEVGYGRTDLFVLNRNRRFKFDGMLVRRLAGSGFSLFAQLYADVDMKDGSDSIQSYFGLNYEVSKLFGGGN